MRTSLRILAVAALVGLGYLLGGLRAFEPVDVSAQEAAQKTDSLNERIKKSYSEMKAIQDELVRSGRYNPAINGLNTFAVTVGGVDAVKDLEDGRGVDPETFAGLYAGQATDEVAVKLKKKGRLLMYNNKVVRLYSIERLKSLWRRRAEIADVGKTIPGVSNP